MAKRLIICWVVMITLFTMSGLSPIGGQAVHAQTCPTSEEGLRTRYTFDATLKWSQRLLQVQQTVHYRNDHAVALTSLVFHSEPHRLSRVNTMTFYNAYDEAGTILSGVTIDEMRMTVPLATPVDVGCDAVVRLQYDINLKELSDTNPLGWLAYTEKQINLAHWFPTIAPFGYATPNEWYTPERHFIGEQSITEWSDFDLTITLENAPQGVVMVAPGTVSEKGEHVWQVVMQGGRELGLSFSTIYKKTEEKVGDVNVELYTFATTYRGSVAQAFSDAKQALTLFSEIYGPYPHERLVLVEGDFPDGLEMSGMAWVSTDWFVGWNGTQATWLTIITVHEIAHEWFYSSVMDNQGYDPYIDESLATYSELLYFERYHPDLVEEWWQFRIRQYNLGTDPVDSTVYGYTNWRPYINTVYFRGVMMLHEIRGQIGDGLFFVWLNKFYTTHQGQIVKPVDFWGAMSRFSYDSTHDIRAKYLSNPNILGE